MLQMHSHIYIWFLMNMDTAISTSALISTGSFSWRSSELWDEMLVHTIALDLLWHNSKYRFWPTSFI